MKLRNKKTGEIAVIAIDPNHSRFTVVGKNSYLYDSLAELNAEWEDYEEPKGMRWVDVLGANDGRVVIQYFNEAEAEKAVEKLKAWKRLRDKGFMFDDFSANAVYFIINGEYIKSDEYKQDMELLFGGEE